MAGSSGVEWVLLDHAAKDPVRVGDVVSADAGGMPIYRVMAIAEGRVWLDDDRHRTEQVMPLERFRWKGSR